MLAQITVLFVWAGALWYLGNEHGVNVACAPSKLDILFRNLICALTSTVEDKHPTVPAFSPATGPQNKLFIYLCERARSSLAK